MLHIMGIPDPRACPDGKEVEEISGADGLLTNLVFRRPCSPYLEVLCIKRWGTLPAAAVHCFHHSHLTVR